MTLPTFLSSEQDVDFRGLAEQLKSPINRALAMYQIELLVQKGLIEVRTNHLERNKFFSSNELGAITPHKAGITHAYYLPRVGSITAEKHQIHRRELRLQFPWLQCMSTFGGIQGYGRQARRTQRRNGRSPPELKLRHKNQYPLELITIQETTLGILKQFAHRWAPKTPINSNKVNQIVENLGSEADPGGEVQLIDSEDQEDTLNEDLNDGDDQPTHHQENDFLSQLLLMIFWFCGFGPRTPCIDSTEETQTSVEPTSNKGRIERQEAMCAGPSTRDPVSRRSFIGHVEVTSNYIEEQNVWEAICESPPKSPCEEPWGQTSGWSTDEDTSKIPTLSSIKIQRMRSPARPFSPHQFNLLEKYNPVRADDPSNSSYRRSPPKLPLSHGGFGRGLNREPFSGSGFGTQRESRKRK